MKELGRIRRIGWAVLTLSLAVAMPAFSQRGGGGAAAPVVDDGTGAAGAGAAGAGAAGGSDEAGAFQKFTKEADPVKKIKLGESFIKSNKKSRFRPQIDQLLAELYASQKDWKKVEEVADRVQKELPEANPKAKARVYLQGMLAARSLNELENAVRFGDMVIAGDPTNINPAQILPATILSHLPTDPAAKTAALNKALDYALKGVGIQKPQGVVDADWNAAQSKIHSSMGIIYGSLNKIPDAITEYGLALKANPKDGASHYRLGMLYFFEMQDTWELFNNANKAAEDAATAKADQAQINDLVNKRDSLATEVMARRDMAIDSFARAMAVGGAVAQPARQQLEPLYMNKNGADSVKGIDQFVDSKKAELGL